MINNDHISIEELQDAYIEIHESFEGASMSFEELQTEIKDGFTEFTSAIDDIRDEMERCNTMIRRLNRRMSPVLSYIMEQEDNELPFPPKKGTSRNRYSTPFEEISET